ncbi:hypothetical protein LCGC14_0586310 [marine sediment metagenome]|uniref:Uncharacterized protein n=1 Tax=marine sediment metagenome TaxID=412755 RepID=A0A0F9REV3_9ZZZZ
MSEVGYNDHIDHNVEMIEYYWESVWNDDGEFICKTCGKVPKDCVGKIKIG